MTIIIAALVFLGLFAPAPAHAGKSILIETRRSTTPNGKPAVALLVNGHMVARLAKVQRQRSPERTISVAAALVLTAYRSGNTELVVRQSDESGRRFTLFLDGKVLLVATDMEGKAWGAPPEELANSWRDNLVAAWVAEDTPASIDGMEEETPVADVPAPAVTVTQRETLAPAGLVRSMPSDYAGLAVSGGHEVHSPPSFTQLSEPAVPSELIARVTGSALFHETARSAVENTIRSYAGLPAASGLNWNATNAAGSNLGIAPGRSRRLKINYTASGDGSQGVSGTVEVLLENKAISTPRESMTFFSNSPEQLSGAQLLYYARLPAGEAGRLVLHHQNQSRFELQLVARMVNTGSAPAAVHVIPGAHQPSINTFYVGFKSAESFWFNLNTGSGYVLTLPPGRQAYIFTQTLKRGYTGIAYFKLTNLGAEPLRLEVMALALGTSAPDGPAADTGGTSRGVFPAPYMNFTATFVRGDPWLYLQLGKQAQASLVDGSVLDGSYGMTHSFSVELNNPGATPALVFVVLRASGGEVKGQFFIDDEYLVTPLLAGGEEQLLKEIPLAPGQTKLLKIKALPLNGGFYPASIILRETRRP